MANTLIGREEETKVLKHFLNSDAPEFLAIHGRRRVGKTFLIKQFFQDKKIIFFTVTGSKDASLREQISHFTKQISTVFYHGVALKAGKNWDETFEILTKAINSINDNLKVVLFFDEFPWMATKNSRLLQSLEYYWNQYWSDNKKIKLIICGSSASWIIENIINNTGGLHNRITKRISLTPFNLAETSTFLKKRGIALSNKQVTELYMVMGGVPYYLTKVEKGMSATQTIETLAFQQKSFLLEEFKNLFSSLFKNADVYIKIITIIAASRYGINQHDLFKKLGSELSGKGGIEKLKALEESGFIIEFTPHLHKQRGVYYKIIDNYTQFYLAWIAPIKTTLLKKSLLKGYWEKIAATPAWHIWSGLAFEALCYEHLPQISKALSLSATAIPNAWRYTPKKDNREQGAQIDLLFERDDDSITICEIKYNSTPFTITKEYAEKLKTKLETFKRVTRTTKQLFLVMITANGLKSNKYAKDLISGVVTLEDLFKYD